jgi:hypothetical protein
VKDFVATFRHLDARKMRGHMCVRQYIYYQVLRIRSRCNLFTLGGPDAQQYGYAHGVCPVRPPVSVSYALEGNVQFSSHIDSSCITCICSCVCVYTRARVLYVCSAIARFCKRHLRRCRRTPQMKSPHTTNNSSNPSINRLVTLTVY